MSLEREGTDCITVRLCRQSNPARYALRLNSLQAQLELVLESALGLERNHLVHDFLQRDGLTSRFRADIISIPEIHTAGICFFRTDSEDEVVLRNFGIADPLVQRGVRQVDLAVDASIPKRLHDLLRVCLVRSSDGHNDRLSWRQPERPGETGQKGAERISRVEHTIFQRSVR